MAEKKKTEKPTPTTIAVRIDRMQNYESSKVKAFASANIGGAFAVHGIKVIDSEKGRFVQMPQTSFEKDGKKQYSDIFHPITADSRKELFEQVLEAYAQRLHMKESESMGTQDENSGIAMQNM